VPRFSCPTEKLSLSNLLKSSRRHFTASLAIALALHAAASQIKVSDSSRKAVKPLTTRFVKREPRLVKPLELRKRPRPKPRVMKRKMVRIKAKASTRDIARGTSALKVLDSLARPRGSVRREVPQAKIFLEPVIEVGEIGSAREPKQQVSMALEMLDIEALDTGRYHAMVIQDPADKRKIKGFLHLAPVYIPSAAAAEASCPYGYGSRYPFPATYRCLANAMNKYTGIKVDIAEEFSIDSQKIFKVPIVFVSYHVPFQITDHEAENVGRYLMAGGFIFSDTLMHNAIPVYRNMVELWKKSLAAVGKVYGRDWLFERLPNSHPLYHCFFDFEGPPHGFDRNSSDDYPPVDYLEGVTIDNRLLGICTSNNYYNPWARPIIAPGLASERVMQFGVNVIVFALIQEGSITRQVMSAVE